MSDEGKFLIFCLEMYKAAKKLCIKYISNGYVDMLKI